MTAESKLGSEELYFTIINEEDAENAIKCTNKWKAGKVDKIQYS